MLRILTSLAVLLASTGFAEEARTIKTRILTYALGGLPDSFTGYYQNGGGVMLFRASDGTLGVPVEYSGSARFLLRPSEAAFSPPPGREPEPPLAAVDLPAGADQVLIVAAPSGKSDGIRLIAYDISSSDLAKGDYMIFNFSHSSLSMIFDTRKILVPPGRETVVRDPRWKSRPLAFPIRIATIIGDTAKPVYSSFWEHQPSNRTLLFIFNGNRPSQAIRLMDFSVDSLPVSTAATR